MRRQHSQIEQELGHEITSVIDLASEVNLLVGFRAAEPLGVKGVVIGPAGVHEIVRLVDSLEANVIVLHGALAPAPADPDLPFRGRIVPGFVARPRAVVLARA